MTPVGAGPMMRSDVSRTRHGERRPPPRWPGPAAAALCALALSACNVDVYTNLDERQANEMVATLARQGIAANRVVGKGGRVSVTVDDSRLAEAIAILDANGLPKQEFVTLGDVFKKDGLVSTPAQERALMIFAQSQEVSRTVSNIPGVVSARVHLVLPENDLLRQQSTPSSAAVFILHQASMPTGDLVPQVKQLVANAVSGLSYEKVSVILRPVETTEQPQPTQFARRAGFPDARVGGNIVLAGWQMYGAVSGALIVAAGFGFHFWRRRQRIYPLSRDRKAAP